MFNIKTSKHLSHIQIISLGYFLIIMIGTFLLMLPISTQTNDIASFTHALFTATSASCVTGLVVEDTATYWSTFGQLVIISLIQIGGLGFMTIATVFLIFLRRKIGLRSKNIMMESINVSQPADILNLTKKIFFATIVFELIGASLLSIRFIPQFGILKGIYYGIFHSVSAFCNAGFDLMGIQQKYSSFVNYSNDTLINLTIMSLIIIGGIGFWVWDDIHKNKLKFKHYRLHTKIVLVITLFLILSGTIAFYYLELNNLEQTMTFKEKILTSMFSSVTARTAGFNTTDTAQLTSGSKLLTIILMFIGGSPGSTAGGIKTTTIAIILLYTFSGIRRQQNISVFGRSIDDDSLKKAISVFFANLTLALLGALIICTVQNINLTDALFEAFSAIGTVGMTTGITRDLSLISKYIIIFLMYCGRVGSISFGLALLEKRARPPITLPAEQIMIG